MNICLKCKKEFPAPDKYQECPHCHSKCTSNSYLEKDAFDSIYYFKNRIVLFKGNESQKPSYATFQGFNKFGWAIFDIVNTEITVFGDKDSFLPITDENLLEFKKLKLNYELNIHQTKVETLKNELKLLN